MTSSELLELFRSDIDDVEAPYLWTDADAFRYMDDAYRMFVRLTGGVSDVTSPETRVDIVTGDTHGVLHPSILRVVRAYRLSDGKSLTIYNSPQSPDIATATGPVDGMVIGEQKGLARWTKIPHEDDTAQLQVYRMPLQHITLAAEALGPQDFVDVDEDHHFHLLKWMRHLAYMKQGADTFDRAKSDENAAEFRAYCDLVVAEWERYKSKVRVIQYNDV